MNIKNLFADDDAVSPVIGVILMVAITVILAAVIGTMVLGLTDNVQENVQAGASTNFDSTTDELSITYTSNQNADYLNATVTSNSGSATFSLGEPGAKMTFRNQTGTFKNVTSGDVGVLEGGDINTNNQYIDDGFDFNDGADDQISVVITAHKGEDSTVILSKDGVV